MKRTLYTIALLICCSAASKAASPVVVDYSASIVGNASTGTFAPYLIGSWNDGRIFEGAGIWHDGLIEKKTSLDTRFSWGAGLEYMLGYGSATDYERYIDDSSTWTFHSNRQAPAMLQQLYGELKFRGVYLLAGMKHRRSGIVDDELSSGDLVRSNNARPIPAVSAGFIDFQNVPFTNGWLQIEGEISYGRFFDNKTKENCFNFYTGEYTQDLMYSYKRCYLRSKPSQPLCVTAGVQNAGVFAGSTLFYRSGKILVSDYRGFKLSQLWNMFFPEHNNGEGNAIGNSLGSWDFKARYRFANDSKLSAYFQWFWEDGSGLAKRNGWDGLWGLQYDFAKRGPVTKIVAEYIDFTNQAGPNHWAPSDSPGTNLTTMVGGADNYYNNDRYGPYANYGMAIGTPFIVAPIYNTDGYWAFTHCRARGFHLAVTGDILPTLSYTFKFSAQKAWGDGRVPQAIALEDYSAGASAVWHASRHIETRLHVAFDAGKLRGNNFGALASVTYKGNFTFNRR